MRSELTSIVDEIYSQTGTLDIHEIEGILANVEALFAETNDLSVEEVEDILEVTITAAEYQNWKANLEDMKMAAERLRGLCEIYKRALPAGIN